MSFFAINMCAVMTFVAHSGQIRSALKIGSLKCGKVSLAQTAVIFLYFTVNAVSTKSQYVTSICVKAETGIFD